MCKTGNDICNDYGFHFLDKVKTPFIELITVGKDIRYSSSYHWNNKNRPAAVLFQYTLSGSGTVKIDNKSYIVDKGKAFFLKMPDDESYCFDEKNNQAPWEFVYIIISGEGVLPYFEYAVQHSGKIMDIPDFHPAVKILLDLYNKAENGLIKNAFAADSRAFEFLCALCDMTVKKSSGLTDRAKNYLEQNFEKQITLEAAARQLGVSQSHLSREFVKHTGEKPIQYLTKLRIERAVYLLNSTDLKLDEISSRCGFSDSNYFGKTFKKYMNISPAEFRRQSKLYGYISI